MHLRFGQWLILRLKGCYTTFRSMAQAIQSSADPFANFIGTVFDGSLVFHIFYGGEVSTAGKRAVERASWPQMGKVTLYVEEINSLDPNYTVAQCSCGVALTIDGLFKAFGHSQRVFHKHR